MTAPRPAGIAGRDPALGPAFLAVSARLAAAFDALTDAAIAADLSPAPRPDVIDVRALALDPLIAAESARLAAAVDAMIAADLSPARPAPRLAIKGETPRQGRSGAKQGRKGQNERTRFARGEAEGGAGCEGGGNNSALMGRGVGASDAGKSFNINDPGR